MSGSGSPVPFPVPDLVRPGDAYAAMQAGTSVITLTTFESVEEAFGNVLTLWQCRCTEVNLGSEIDSDGQVMSAAPGPSSAGTAARAGAVAAGATATDAVKGVVGFDLEWRPHGMGAGGGEGENCDASCTRDDALPPHVNPHRVALMQITLRVSNNNNNNSTSLSSVTYLIHMHQVFNQEPAGAPAGVHPQYQNCALFIFLRDPQILKCGVGIAGDKKKLAIDYAVSMGGTIELGVLMRKVVSLQPPLRNDNIEWKWKWTEGLDSTTSSSSWSLHNIVQQVCRVSLPKNKAIQCSDWAAVTLTKEQLLYAAADAYFGLLAYEGLLQYAQAVCSITSFSDLVEGVRDCKTSLQSFAAPHYSTAIASNDTLQHTTQKARRDGLTMAKSPIYDSCALLSKEGAFLSYCDSKKLNWYLSKNLAVELSEESVLAHIAAGTLSAPKSGKSRVVRLNFAAKGAGNINDSYKRQQLHNVCVVCGVEQLEPAQALVDDEETTTVETNSATTGAAAIKTVIGLDKNSDDEKISSSLSPPATLLLLHHHVVPKVYRKLFPSQMVSKNNHDIVPVCRPCKARVADLYAVRIRALEDQYLDASDRSLLLARLKTNKTELVHLSKVQGYCQTLLTSTFYKKVRTENADGSKRTDQVQVSEANAKKIKESVMITLQHFLQTSKFPIDEENSVACFDAHAEVMKLNIDDSEGIRHFLQSFENMIMHDIERKKHINSSADTGDTCVSSGSRSGSNDDTIRNKETLIFRKLIKPFCVDDDVTLYIPLLQKFETMWRSFFLETVRPLHMLPHWRVDYKHDTTTRCTATTSA